MENELSKKYTHIHLKRPFVSKNMSTSEDEVISNKIKIYRDYWGNGNLKEITYMENGLRHRTDGPAYQRWSKKGVLVYELWCHHGTKHRTDGPAFRTYGDDGIQREEGWYLRGKILRGRELENMRKPAEYSAILVILPQPIYEEIWEHFLVF